MFPVADVIRSRTTPWMTIGLVVANIAFALYAASLPPADAHLWAERLAFKPADASWLTATMSLFVHQNGAHMFLNVIVLWIFGDNAEDQLGHVRFLFLYLLAGYVGWLSVLWATTWPANPTVALVGPGGAIAGVLGAYFVMFPRSRVLVLVPARSIVDAIELPAVLVAAAWFSLQVLSLATLDGPFEGLGLSLWPYLGGAVAGTLAVLVIRRPERRRVEWWGA
jgi:membrane associated rhomboid family serine protease